MSQYPFSDIQQTWANGTSKALRVKSETQGFSTITTLQNAVSSTGNGSSADVSNMATAVFDIQGTFIATITFEGTIDDSIWYPIYATQIGGNIISSTTTTTGLYTSVVSGLKSVRAKVTWISGTSVTVKVRVSSLESPSKAGSNVEIGGVSFAVSGGDTLRNTAANKPNADAAHAAIPFCYYHAIDTGAIEVTDGTNWVVI